MGQVLQEAGGQSGEIVPTGEHAVSGPHQRTAQRTGPEQLLPQQRCAGGCVLLIWLFCLDTIQQLLKLIIIAVINTVSNACQMVLRRFLYTS